MKTYMARSEDFVKKWYLIDGEGKTVGRLATRIATILRGKDKPQFTPHADIGDFVIVVNAEKLKFTGDKWNQKTYYRHTHYPGGIKSITAGDLLKTKPHEIIEKAVWGMLPKNKWQKKLIARLKVYAGSEHPHAPQQPETLEV
ncbi:MAG: 50S ribosomal protein L13 [Candidatus Dadabacteria bacterium]|nr:50S ribosomal protein L13 [Candidatus Dadabacteria bacterium]TDJ01440.1 MAG: 50S ribosomal protein L13 [Candidatus Dadabacteria bacterium]